MAPPGRPMARCARARRAGAGSATDVGATPSMVSVAQAKMALVRAYTPGVFTRAHPCPHDTTPISTGAPDTDVTRGPPESPWHESVRRAVPPAQISSVGLTPPPRAILQARALMSGSGTWRATTGNTPASSPVSPQPATDARVPAAMSPVWLGVIIGTGVAAVGTSSLSSAASRVFG